MKNELNAAARFIDFVENSTNFSMTSSLKTSWAMVKDVFSTLQVDALTKINVDRRARRGMNKEVEIPLTIDDCARQYEDPQLLQRVKQLD